MLTQSTFVALLVSLLLTISQATAWSNPDRHQWHDTEFSKSEDGFGALLLLTTDLDWSRKWNTPPETTPYLERASAVKVGEELLILTLFAGPKVDTNKNAHLRCGLKITKPDKTTAIDERGIPCFDEELIGHPNNIRVASTIVKFVGEQTDPRGEWIVDMEVTDVLRSRTLPLRARFTLLDGS